MLCVWLIKPICCACVNVTGFCLWSALKHFESKTVSKRRQRWFMKHQHEASPSRGMTSCKILFLTQNAYLLSVSLLSTLSPFADLMAWIMAAVTLNSRLFSRIHWLHITQPGLLTLKEFYVCVFFFWSSLYHRSKYNVGIRTTHPTADRDSIYFLKHNTDCCLCIWTPGVSGKGRSVSVNNGPPFTY